MKPTIPKKVGQLMFLRNHIGNFWVLLVFGFLTFSGVIVILNLPTQMRIGEKAQAAIQMLDAMRRPFLAIMEVEIRLIETGDAKSAVDDFAKAIESANVLLARYQQSAQYNSELSRRVAQLLEVYEDWVAAERHLFDKFRNLSPHKSHPPTTKHHLEDMNIVSSGFLSTMKQLGEGEEPIHADIDSGRRAAHVFLASLSAFLFYVIGLTFWQQRARTQELHVANAQLHEGLRKMEAAQFQLIQSEKLAAIGILAAGVAHELNQPLMVIRGYAQELLADKRIADDEMREDLGRIEAQTTRMTAIISHLRDFSRQSKGKQQPTDLNHVVAQAFTFLGQQLKTRNIDVVQELDPALPAVWADPLQIEQVLLNLVTNARDAMEKVGKGVIVIRTEQAGDGRVALSVTDTGPGIPPDLKARIFDPFFTTKEVGKGTGLGLSICHGIAEEHGGELRVESPVAEDRGARFTLVLPRSLRDASGGERG